MDGNGRWAKKRYLPRVAGHRRGVEAVREVVKACAARGVEYLTLFAFSSENWRRPGRGSDVPHAALPQGPRAGGGQAPRQRHPLQGDRRPRAPSTRSSSSTFAGARSSRRPTRASRSRWRPTTAGAGTSCRPPTAAARAPRRGDHRGAPVALPVDELRAGAGPLHPHRRRGAHLQLPALAARLHRASTSRPPCGPTSARRRSTRPSLPTARASGASAARASSSPPRVPQPKVG